MKLEEKHIALYTPHNLKCEILNYKSDYVGEKYLTIKGYYIYDGDVYFNFHEGRDFAGKSISEFKPILRPLTDLGKEIEHEGKKFNPIIMLLNYTRLGEYDYECGTDYDSYVIDYFLGHSILCKEKYSDDDYFCVKIEYVLENEYWIVEKLIEWHFDVFRLIENKLAVDINTIKIKL